MAEEISLNGDATGKPLKVLGDFKIIRTIGKGGMAMVYEAEQISLKRRVALKVLPPHLSFHDQAVKRFQREAEAGSRPQHPGIISIYCIGEDQGLHYFAEELIEGDTSLADLLNDYRQEKTLPLGYYQRGASIIAGVADALQHAHDSGVIHRDVKPPNILITKDGLPVVCDFGLAKVENALSLSRTGDFMGTPYYMSPEQAMSRRVPISHRTDIYSLGVTLYEVLTLKKPFEGESSHEVLKKIIFHDPVSPSKHNPRVPADLSTICMKAMEKNPTRRYATMRALQEDLNRYLHGEVISARPAGFFTRAAKRARRHPALSAAVFVVVIALLAVVFNWFWSLNEIVKQKNKAEVVNRFLEQILMSADPDRDGREVKVVEILDKASKKIGKAFPNQPEIQASLRIVLGWSYHTLGIYDSAEKHQRAGLDLLRQHLGDADPETLKVMNDLGGSLLFQGRYAEAEALLRTALDIYEAEGEDDHPGALIIRDNLAGALWGQGRLAEAEVLYRSMITKFRESKGEDAKETLIAMNNLCMVLRDLKKYDEAETLLEQVLKIRQDTLGEEHTQTLRTKNNLASLYYTEKKYAEAERMHNEVLKVQIARHGESHGDTLITMTNLVETYCNQDRYAEAERLSREVLDKKRNVLGKDNPQLLNPINNHVSLLMVLEKYSAAEALLKEGEKIALKTQTGHIAEGIALYLHYGKCLAFQKKFNSAEPYMLIYYRKTEEANGAEHADTRIALNNLVRFYDDWGNKEKSKLFRTALSAMEKKPEE